MEPGTPGPHHQQLVDTLTAARHARRGVPAALEPVARAYAREQREAGRDIARVLVDVKALVRDLLGDDEPLFTPKVVGWTVAGYFAGTRGRRDEG